ncbi:MAG: cytochrome c biogenesis protein CcsA, partial [Phycisphaerales bacterium]|nr:cytochrome c biogenesis protein CcsA [Phycisphaerales bacterium]
DHLSTLAADHPARVAALDLGRAWRARDAAAVNDAARIIAAELPKIHPTVYPGSRRDLELAYNRSKPFEWGYWMYFVSLLALILAFGTERRWLIVTGVVFLFAALGLHAFGFGARCIIAERFAIQNQYESMTGVSLFAVLLASVLMLVRRQWLFGAAAAAVGFMILITATQTGIPGSSIEREAAILNTSVLLKYHVTTVLVSYGLIALGFVISLFYLLAHFLQRNAPQDVDAIASAALGTGTRTLRDLDRAQMTVLQLAFWTLGVGILLGAWWADHSWGRWWAFDPKETWALATWIIYLIVIHVRFGAKNRGLTTAWLSIVGFVVMLWTYFGVNLLLPGLHAYA